MTNLARFKHAEAPSGSLHRHYQLPLDEQGRGPHDWATAWDVTDHSLVYRQSERLLDDEKDEESGSGAHVFVSVPVVSVSAAVGIAHDIAGRLDHARHQQVLSGGFLAQVLRFTSWDRGWDGEDADPIAGSTVIATLSIALRMSAHVSSGPSVAPMVDGALVLRWTFENGSALEIVIEDDGQFPTYAMLSKPDGVVDELALTDEATLSALLDRQGQYGDPRIRSASYFV